MNKIKMIAVVFGFLFASTAFAQELKPGDKAPKFTLKNVDNQMVSLDDYKDQKGVILIFTCNHCPFAVAWEDRKIALQNEFAAQGFPVVAINPNDPKKQPEDSFEKMQERVKEIGINYPYLIDETQEIAKAYGATRTPHVYLLENKGGKFEIAYVGAIDDNHKDAKQVQKTYLADAIYQLAAGKEIANNYTKAVGCTIKWKE
ncbi:MAG: thioredoxin family protein [Cyclobacteriaceae bacterium]|nr:thioredoxin family protein [Cyclobacteriaceae bacterium]MCH8516121.1 thioredoxin family protein [Cyclobacteriaceae bacterium]